jgi:FlaA1/EpsC-like NDP-sugar epimerase
MRRILGRSRVDAVIHVAAHKHVPMAESQPVEYIRNNVFGTQVILEAAQDAGASQFLLVSTDKAARPSGVMGRTKWIAERLVLAASTEAFTCAAVRFGNVLGSSGSVLQRFQEQVAAGDPLLITDPQMTRYFMTPTEAAYTIVLALAFADGGDLCSIDLGAPVAIGTLADRFLECVDASTASRAAACAEVVGRRRGERTHEHPPRGDRLGQTSLLVSREPRCSPAALTEAVRALEEICREEEPPAAAARLEQLMEPLRMARGSALSPQA